MLDYTLSILLESKFRQPTKKTFCTICDVCTFQGFECVFYRYNMFIVQGVEIVPYRVYRTGLLYQI